jgi:hypothetical protein
MTCRAVAPLPNAPCFEFSITILIQQHFSYVVVEESGFRPI